VEHRPRRRATRGPSSSTVHREAALVIRHHLDREAADGSTRWQHAQQERHHHQRAQPDHERGEHQPGDDPTERPTAAEPPLVVLELSGSATLTEGIRDATASSNLLNTDLTPPF
jgi:hypothetical protein